MADTYLAPRRGWTCFHCGDHFASDDAGIAAAREHFGPTPDWSPECLERRGTPTEQLVQRTRTAEADALAFRDQRDAAETETESAQAELSTVRHRFGVKYMHEAWDMYHAMEGRSLAAEAVLRELEAIVPEALLAARVTIAGPGTYFPLAGNHWRTPAIAWLRKRAADQAATNARYPQHALTYPAWTARVRHLEGLANQLEHEHRTKGAL